jgi:DhnA family fructose-bisphosphate aldolase class Ia
VTELWTRYPEGLPGQRIRLGRVVNPETGRGVVATIAHGAFLGPLTGEPEPGDTARFVRALGDAGADAVLVTPGTLAQAAHGFVGRGAPGSMVVLDWTNQFREDPALAGFPEGRPALVSSVEDALRLGADAVLTYLFLGLDDPRAEADLVAYNGRVSRDCERLGVARAIEFMARGRKVGERARDPQLVRLGVRLAAEIGADVIKCEWTGDVESFRQVVRSCAVPVFVAGGPSAAGPLAALELAHEAIRAGAQGLVFGRNVVQAPSPTRMVAALAGIVHRGWTVAQASAALERSG